MLPDPKGMVNPVPRDADYPIPTVVGRGKLPGVRVPQGGVIGHGSTMSGREGYRSSSVSCWDHRFDYGQRRHHGVPHFTTEPLTKRKVGGTPRALGYPHQTPPFKTIVQFGAWGLYRRCYELRYPFGSLLGGGTMLLP